MTYRNLIKKLSDIIIEQEFINDVYIGDVYDINYKDVKYPLMCIEPLSINVKEGVNKCEFRVIYVDRSTESGNIIDITSDMLYTFNSLKFNFNNLEDIDIVMDSNITLFNQDFKDKCSGGITYMTVTEYYSYSYCK